jgi:RNA polymerase sigma factor (sigma-70 family)
MSACIGSADRVTPLPSDADLIARVVARADGRAFEQLVLRYQSLVRGFLRRLTADTGSADDAAQETFIKAYGRLTQFRGDAKFGTWLIAIAYNEFRQIRRQRLRQDRIASVARDDTTAHHVGVQAEALDLPKLLAWLEDDERAVFVLSYAHEYSHREISQVTGLPLGTVKSHLTRGKARILARLRDSESRHDDGRRPAACL